MANQIARNFGTMNVEDTACATADHIATFWDPRMKAMIFADPSGLSPVATAAIDLLRAHAALPPQTRPTQFNTGGNAGASDAG